MSKTAQNIWQHMYTLTRILSLEVLLIFRSASAARIQTSFIIRHKKEAPNNNPGDFESITLQNVNYS